MLKQDCRVEVRAYEELGRFLPRARRKVSFKMRFPMESRVRDLLRVLGIPTEEVELVLIDGNSVGVEATLVPGARVALYPVFECFDVSSLLELRKAPLRQPAFLLDAHLGGLARYLRLFGFDADLAKDEDDRELVARAEDQARVLLTRDRGLLEELRPSRALFVTGERSRDQLGEIVRRLDLAGLARPFTRCLRCNVVLTAASDEQLARRISDRLRELHEEFRICGSCDRLYWPGSHYRRMQIFVGSILRPRDDAI